jgi:tetratricopeptide (TPR) repeat protein
MAQAVDLAADLPFGIDFRFEYAAELERADRNDEAERELREVVRRHPDLPEALLSLAAYLTRHNSPEEARQLAEKVLAGMPEPEVEKSARRLLERLKK